MKKVIIFILFALISFLACNNNSNISKTINNNYSNNTTVKVGIYVYDYPLLYLRNNNLGGFDYDIMNEIAKASGFRVEFISMEFSKLIPQLQLSNVDAIIAGISITEERKKYISFSDKYYSSSQSIIVLSKNNHIKIFDDLLGKSVGVIKDTISDTIISSSNNINVIKFDIAGSSLLALKVEKIDAVMLDRVTCNNYIKYDNDLKIIEEITFPELDYGIAVRKDDYTLLQKINNGLNTIIYNGIYQKLVDKHLQ
ncbi:amino acid ABC transporter substrate-binding protein [Brachyspira hampsonii]|uniref:Amino acid ABC transporter substrate-binding protein n=1 Tax=Brachyspira hampsonii TaxID=1287055 RepID=A0A1E5NCP0_9SPIR|nr:transporter substrate-binding domain-containing protein [Brachyspira hampsonii]OEJ13939.1 amino acid ABC transporter substrate-binding protein [Brachyspira hampsonii]